jgi:molecular chaperone GrpE
MTPKKHNQDPDKPAPRQEPPATEPPAGDAGQAQPETPEAVKAERDDLLARLQRVSADYLNYQKRVQREMTEGREFANTNLIRDLLAVLDDMERAMEAARENHADDPLLAGMQLVYEKALEVLGRYGLKRIDAEGEPFDPTCHEAMMQQPSEEHETPTVLQELQSGYELKGRVIRPARVVVSGPPGNDRPQAEDPEKPADGPAEREGE